MVSKVAIAAVHPTAAATRVFANVLFFLVGLALKGAGVITAFDANVPLFAIFIGGRHQFIRRVRLLTIQTRFADGMEGGAHHLFRLDRSAYHSILYARSAPPPTRR